MKKFFKIFAIVLLVLILAVFSLPFLFKGKIVQLVKDEANKQLTARVDFDNDIGLSLIKNFPNLTLTLKNFSIADTSDFEKDTLVSMKTFSTTLNLMSVIKGNKVEILSIILDNPRIHAKVDRNGKANWDIVKASADTATTTKPADTTSNFKMSLKKLQINNGYIVYDDEQGGIYTRLEGMNTLLNGDFTQDVFTLKTKTDALSVTFGMDGLNYLNGVKANLLADIEMDMKNMKFTFKENELQLNELFAGFDGFVAMPGDDINMDLKFAARKTDFKNILSLVPAVFTKDFSQVKTSGKMALSGVLKGTYNEKSIPGFNVKLLIEDGTFQYPGMPTDMRNIQVDLAVTNPDGVLDNTVVDLKKLNFTIANEPFSARLYMKNPMTDPYFDLNAKGKVDLAQVSKLAPLEKGTKISGIVQADMSAKGRESQVERMDFERFQASGSIIATNVVYDTDSMPETSISTMKLVFSPESVELPAFSAKIGNSDVDMKGYIRDFFGYFIGGKTLYGQLDVKSNLFDANQFVSPSESKTTTPQATDTVPLEPFAIPKNVNFTLNLSVGKFLYDNLQLTNLGGTAKVENQVLNLDGVHSDIFGGTVNMNGSYNAQNIAAPTTALKLNVSNIDIAQSYKYMNTVKALAPIAQYMEGKVNATFGFNSLLGHDMMPIMSSLTSAGKLEIPKARLDGYMPSNKLAEVLKVDNLKSLDINKLLLQFKIEDGKIKLEPFKTSAGGINMLISGASGIDQSLDYDVKLDIPRSMFGQANTALDNLLSEVGKKGVELKPNEIIKVNALVGGFVQNPIIKTSLKELAKSTLDDLKDVAKKELEEKKQEAIQKVDEEAQKLIDKARAEGDRLIADAQKQADQVKAEAQKQADALVAEADKQADKLVQEAGSNPIKKLAAQKAGDKLKSEARTKADKAKAEANTKADGMVNEARVKADKMVKDAEAQKNKNLSR